MKECATPIAADLFRVFDGISKDWKSCLSKTRYLTRPEDALRHVTEEALLREEVAGTLASLDPTVEAPVVVFLDRRGGRDSARVACSLIEMCRIRRCVFVHVAFGTPIAGVGTLLQSMLMRKGSDCGVLVDVVAIPQLAKEFVEPFSQWVDGFPVCDVLIHYAPSGTAGFLSSDSPLPDPLISLSDVNALSFPDPEHLVADLHIYEDIIAARPGFNHIRFRAEVREGDTFQLLGECVLGSGGTAREDLWKLLDNARRQVYRVLLTPIGRDGALGDPLYAYCGRWIEQGGWLPLKTGRFLQMGGDSIVTGAGNRCHERKQR